MKKQREWPITTSRRSILGNTYDNRELNVKQHVSGCHTQNRQRSYKTDLIKALSCNRFASRDPHQDNARTRSDTAPRLTSS
ncbi:Unknown protein sequence [Pseudomonas syringae pv. cilantro]|uniref:Uncharacterized protein n=1 Tax=Pseudomonas syringae pv. cilantro TaxID=81035 RepID=A0A0N0GHZ3_PSESX|nr:Unknown protein sequence [Pseudomonas syringae pv. cilantro]